MEMSFERNREGQMEHADATDTPEAVQEEVAQDMHTTSLAIELSKIIDETMGLDLIPGKVFDRFCSLSNEFFTRLQVEGEEKDVLLAALQDQNRLLSQKFYEQGLFLTQGGTV